MSDKEDPTAPAGPSEYRWSAVRPDGALPDEPIDYVSLAADEYAGPFRGRDCVLTSDYAEMHAMLGISRALYDDIMAWNDDAASLPRRAPDARARPIFERQQQLLRRLAAEVRRGIEVERPRDAPSARLVLLELVADTTADPPFLQQVDRATGRRLALPAAPADLVVRVAGWIARSYLGDDPDEVGDDAVFAWQDEGAALVRELGDILGDRYVLTAF
jgi:hypothetical protein